MAYSILVSVSASDAVGRVISKTHKNGTNRLEFGSATRLCKGWVVDLSMETLAIKITWEQVLSIYLELYDLRY